MSKRKTKSENSLYMQVLIWAYENDRFTQEELWRAIGISTGRERQWVIDNFFYGLNGGGRPLIQVVPTEGSGDRCGLSERGVAAAIDYLELKEARRGSRRATIIAVISITIGIIVGFIQILIQLNIIKPE